MEESPDGTPSRSRRPPPLPAVSGVAGAQNHSLFGHHTCVPGLLGLWGRSSERRRERRRVLEHIVSQLRVSEPTAVPGGLERPCLACLQSCYPHSAQNLVTMRIPSAEEFDKDLHSRKRTKDTRSDHGAAAESGRGGRLLSRLTLRMEKAARDRAIKYTAAP